MSYMFFSSGDAPSGYDMYSSPSSLLDILDLCLVIGYSGHQALGWTIEDRSETHRVYRAASGSQRKFLRVAITADSTMHAVNVYDSIAPETNRWFTPEVATSNSPLVNNWPCLKSSTPLSPPAPWVLFGDSQFFTLIVTAANQSSPADSSLHFLFFGEVDGATYLNINPVFAGSGNGTQTRLIRNSSAIGSANTSLFTNLDNPNILSQFNGQQVFPTANVINFDSVRDSQRLCWPCGFMHTMTEASQTSSTQFGVRTLNDMRLVYDGVLPYAKLYFVTRNNFVNDRLGMQILASHPHILISGASAADTVFGNAAVPMTTRLAESKTVNIDGVSYTPFIISNSSSAIDSPFIFIRVR